ncbi:hypothetical protein GDO86_010794 [Hymenochirus boettgeri]|uniref:Uncharacterized protein n=1 Tax=Hymenochirus boettgeri TaxID=247094 RepID=A0A8T2JEP1_9PIPI|nr:hypothetical protein GDO86_010794 [Hymenochirus boettgeri]
MVNHTASQTDQWLAALDLTKRSNIKECIRSFIKHGYLYFRGKEITFWVLFHQWCRGDGRGYFTKALDLPNPCSYIAAAILVVHGINKSESCHPYQS